jgi:LemA protein
MKRALIFMPVLLVATVGAATTFVKVRESLTGQRADIASEWQRVDEALQQRGQLVHNLYQAAQGLTPKEAEIGRDIESARDALAGNHPPKEKFLANEKLSAALAKLLVSSENHPKLRADREFLHLQDEIRRGEDRVAEERLKYNDLLEHYNARIQSFPSNVVAKISGFTRNDAYFHTERF